MFDEMYIRQHVQWDNSAKKMMGYCTYGFTDEDDQIEATEALVFMVTGLRENFRIPVLYHFVRSLDATKKKELLLSIITEITNVGVILVNVTCDAFPTNQTMFKLLGANLDVSSDSFQTFFLGPNNEKIYITFDACHLQKLVRNTIAEKQVYNSNNEKIEWKHFLNVVQHQESRNLHGFHKMTMNHLKFKNNKMKVSLAVETLSNSTAQTMLFLKQQNVSEFLDCEATAQFIIIFDKLFDIFNSKSFEKENGFKRPLNNRNKDDIFSFFTEATDFIKALTIDDRNVIKPICASVRKAAFAGYIIDIASLKQMYEDYVDENQQTMLPYIATFHFSQDHLETYFGLCRSKHGCNDNPTVEQYMGEIFFNIMFTSNTVQIHCCIVNILFFLSIHNLQAHTG